jgi:hypothetical protein
MSDAAQGTICLRTQRRFAATFKAAIQFVDIRSTNQKLASSTTAAEQARTQRATNIGFSLSFQMTGGATAAILRHDTPWFVSQIEPAREWVLV